VGWSVFGWSVVKWSERLRNRVSVTIRRYTVRMCRSQWPCDIRRRFSATRLLRSWVRIPPGGWMFFCCECCVLSGRGFRDGFITRPEESYRLWCVVLCDQETSKTRRLKPATGLWQIQTQWVVTPGRQTNKHTGLMKFVAYMAVSFVTFCHILLVLLFIIVYMVLCFVCFYLIL
jgi:hypothetical protein